MDGPVSGFFLIENKNNVLHFSATPGGLGGVLTDTSKWPGTVITTVALPVLRGL